MTSTDDELVSRLQAHLSTIRKAAGWSGERLANELGITKQTVSSLETGKTQMTKMHYLAIRAVFNNEIAVSGNEDLAKIIQLFVVTLLCRNTTPPLGPGMAPRTAMMPSSGSTWTTSRFRTVTCSLPI